jgi:hypothetical protein
MKSATQLKAWAMLQQFKYILGQLSQAQIEKLESLKGWSWYPSTMSKKVAEAQVNRLSRIVEGRCEVCGMTLTDIKSIALGIGPECRKNLKRNKVIAAAYRLNQKGAA